METVLGLVLRLLADIIGDFLLGTLFYWLGWPWVKLFTLGRYPCHGWRSGHPEERWVQCVGLAVLVLGLMATLGQFDL